MTTYPHEPTGEEWRTPVKIKATSATERASFRKCRRNWLLTTVHRLEGSDGNPHFWFGELIHTALETYYKARMEPALVHELAAEKAIDAFEEAYHVSLEPIKEQLGWLWPQIEQVYHDMGLLGIDMLKGYFAREKFYPLGDEIVQVEQRLWIPIKSPSGRVVGKLSVRADIVVRTGGRLAVSDHKTAGQRMSSAHLDIDDQLSAEVYAVWKALGEFPEQAIYNALLKKAPKPPKELLPDKKTGVRKLSKAKDQGTTYDLYLATINELGLDASDYAEILADLKEIDEGEESPYFVREGTFRTPGQMAEFERNLYEEWKDMQAVAAHPERAYPNPGPFNCPSCPVKIVCRTMMDGGDVGQIIRNEYVVIEPRY